MKSILPAKLRAELRAILDEAADGEDIIVMSKNSQVVIISIEKYNKFIEEKK